MNKFAHSFLILCVVLATAVSGSAQQPSPHKQPKGEEFFIISSVDKEKSELLLKRPTEVTVLMKSSDSTKYENEAGKPLKLSDFRAGDTVWITYGRAGASNGSISRIRKGPMTVDLLRRLYLRNFS